MKICAVIPAAGRGSRLGLPGPKLLAPIHSEETVWTMLRRKLIGLVDHLHVILSPSGFTAMQLTLEDSSDSCPTSLSIQPQPTGMGDAIFCGQRVWSQAETILILWGDQVHVSRDTLRRALDLHAGAPRCLVLPLVALSHPYVEYRFDDANRLVAVRQSREGDACMPGGLGDVGTFVLSTAHLVHAWSTYRQWQCLGARTAEINFLPFLVCLARQGWEVKPLRVDDPLEARGINTAEDLAFFQRLYGGGCLSEAPPNGPPMLNVQYTAPGPGAPHQSGIPGALED
jgi:bifunctional UDP-N-acetylglucosamine pyrophosphorylase/glucosamine-1-phosphate N-acetyltransferase